MHLNHRFLCYNHNLPCSSESQYNPCEYLRLFVVIGKTSIPINYQSLICSHSTRVFRGGGGGGGGFADFLIIL